MSDCPLCAGGTAALVVCSKCRRDARRNLQAYQTRRELLAHRCDHVRICPALARRPTVQSSALAAALVGPWRGAETDCDLCHDEMRKELTVRHKKTGQVGRTRASPHETLLTKCCRAVAVDPMLLLTAASTCLLPDSVWETVYEHVPRGFIAKQYDAQIDASRRVNDSAGWMYKTIGVVFSRFVDGYDPSDVGVVQRRREKREQRRPRFL